MVSQLTVSERQLACWILAALMFVGLVMAAVDPHGTFGTHGFITMIFSGALFFYVLGKTLDPEPSPDRLAHYYDDPGKVGVVLAMFWGVVGMGIGDWVAWLMAYPEWTFVDSAWASYGRLRPLHTSGVIFGFGGNALIATSFHVVQRTSRARLADQLSPWFVLIGYNLFCIIAGTGYLMGVT